MIRYRFTFSIFTLPVLLLFLVHFLPEKLPAQDSEFPISDSQIENRIQGAFLQHPGLKSYNISVFSVNGVVKINGTVPSYNEKDLADHLARKMPGVKTIHNNLTVFGNVKTEKYYPSYTYNYYYPSPSAGNEDYLDFESSDPTIEGEITEALRLSFAVEDYEIDLEVKQGVVILSGTVDTVEEHDEALRIARQSEAVAVIDYLMINPLPERK